MANFYADYPFISQANSSWKGPVASAVNLPAIGNIPGDTYITLDTDTIYIWNGSSWIAVATPGAAIAIDGLIGDVTATGPGVAPATVAQIQGTTVNGTTGTGNVAFSSSPAFTDIPTAPTASIGTSTTQLATTAFVLSQGFTGAAGSIPSVYQASTSVVTSATTTYVTAISTTITITATSAPVWAIAEGTFTVTSAVPTVAKIRVSINGVEGQEQLLSLTALTTNYIGTAQYQSAALGPGTYNILFEIARNSGTGTVSFFEGSLAAIALQGASSNGITQLTGALQAGPGSGSQALTGTLPLANGGTNSTAAAVNGAVVYSTASAHAYTAAGTAGQLLRSAGTASPTWTSETFPASTTINQILYSSANNVVSGLATANTGALVTSSTGVPSIASGTTANRVLRTNGTTVSFAQVAAATDISGTLAATNGGTGHGNWAIKQVPFGTGTTLTGDPLLIYDTTNNQFTIGNGAGTGKLSSVVLPTDPNQALIAGNFYSRSTNKPCLQGQNENTLPTLSAINAGSTFGSWLNTNFNRGTLIARTQSLNGDAIFTLNSNGYTDLLSTSGYVSQIQTILSEDTTSTANGGELSFSTTPNGTTTIVERIRIKNSGETVFANAIATAQYTTVNKNLLTPNPGWVVYDTTLNQLSYYNGTIWINL